jgi:hypothetical protein
MELTVAILLTAITYFSYELAFPQFFPKTDYFKILEMELDRTNPIK